MRRPLGCLTFTALLTAVLAVVAILAATVVSGSGIFSPGQLSAVEHGGPLGSVSSHADLGGRCAACHAAAWSSQRMGDLCLACHATVQGEITSKGGLHGRIAASATNCRDCHTEHRGATASVTLADPRVFPHEQTGYSLAAHPLKDGGGGVGCRDCHPGSPVTFTAPTCVACHQALDAPYMAAHLETFGPTCLNCHDGVDSYGASFDHATYPLTAGHEGPLCGACHQGATTLAALQTTSTECVSCHAAKDIHEGRLGTSCAECHTTASWTEATIDHDRTRFVLVGKHVGALCESCHVDRRWTGIGMTCRSCHAAEDPHAGQFTGDCAACHVPTGWKDVSFDHATTRFALVLAHAKPACVACHPNGRYVGTPMSCAGCHAGDDKHRGSLGKDCAACHKATTWAASTFNHDKARFPLTGAHRRVTCQKCHAGDQYTGTPTACSACHSKPSSHGSAYAGSCASCHATKAWLPAKFDHSKAKFPLTGAHRSVTCQKCHAGGRFKGTPTTCSACHTKPSSHGTAFSGACSSCHKTKAWLPASFSGPHPFPQSHGGAGGTCSKCHPSSLTSYSCARCHSNTTMKEHHKEVSGFSLTTCVKCHPKGQKGD